jgi:hypothetical protein
MLPSDLPCGHEMTTFPYYLVEKKAFTPVPQIKWQYPLLIHCLFNDAFNTSDETVTNGRSINEKKNRKGFGRKPLWPNLKYYPVVYLEIKAELPCA